MKKSGLILVLGIILIGLFICIRIYIASHQLENKYSKISSSNINYDQNLIQKVQNLEKSLEENNSFTYKGDRDPIGQQFRTVIESSTPQKIEILDSSTVKPQALPQKKMERSVKKNNGSKPSLAIKSTVPKTEEKHLSTPNPKIRVTALFYNQQTKRYSGMILINERSYNVEIGDRADGFQVVNINSEQIILSDGNQNFILGMGTNNQ